MTQSTLLHVKTSDIVENDVTLRGADVENDKFKELLGSIRAKGIMQPISIKPHAEIDDKYVLVDGLQRFTCACILKLPEVPAIVLDIADADILETQIEANMQRIETKPIQYTRALLRLMLNNPNRTLEDQAKRLNKSVGWLRDRLSLTTFEGRTAELVDEGTITMSNAYALAKIARLAPEEVDDWVDRAITMSPDEFIPEALAREKQLKLSQKGGKPVAGPTGPVAKLRKLGDIKAEFMASKARAAKAADDPFHKGYLEAMKFVLQQDDVTVSEWAKAEAERKAQKEEKAKEREAAKANKEEKDLTIADLIKLPKPKSEE